MDSVRLERLNAYLISKGKPPKELNKNFVKSNVKRIKKQKSPKINQSRLKNELRDESHVSNYQNSCPALKANIGKSTLLSSKENRPPVKVAMALKSQPKQLHSSVHSQSLRYSNSCKTPKTQTPNPGKVFLNSLTPSQKKATLTPKRNLSAMATKKLLRRSINTGLVSSQRKSNLICSSERKDKKPVAFTPTPAKRKKFTIKSEKIIRSKKIQPAPISKTPSKNSATEAEKEKRLEQLKLWMISKGKDPSKLCGFKPVKTMLTPVSSPVTKDFSSQRTSQWPTLRDADYFDAVSVLVQQTMHEAESCLQSKCTANEVYAQLIEFSKNVPVAEEHACYWTTLALVYERLGRTENEILELFEKAIQKKAQPLPDITQALQDFVSSQISKPSPTKEAQDLKLPLPTIAPLPSLHCTPDIPVKQHNSLHRPKAETTSVNTETAFVYDFNSPLITESPSSVVKLRLVPQSSPVFKKLVRRKALPFDVSAIVTPVRRSKRIESAQKTYPKSLLSHDTCTTPHDLLKLSCSQTKEAKNYAFDRNKAFGNEYGDVQTLLQF